MLINVGQMQTELGRRSKQLNVILLFFTCLNIVHLYLGDVKTLAGGTKGFKDGVKLQAQFFHPVDIAIDGVGIYMYISDHVGETLDIDKDYIPSPYFFTSYNEFLYT